MKDQDKKGLTPALVILMSVATGLSVACNYYSQPLLKTIASHFDLSINLAGFIVTLAQLGYAVGLMLLVPLGDILERRRLIVVMSLLTTGGMIMIALSQSLAMMLAGTLLTGLFSVVAQILVPLAATLAVPEKRGKTVGTIMSGLLLGILLARTVAGGMAELGDWRTIYWVASLAMLLTSIALWYSLPRSVPKVSLNYPRLLLSIFSIYANDRIMRNRAVIGCLSFANFSVLWTSMAFLLSAPPWNYSEAKIGLFGLVGAAAVLVVRQVGALVDKGKAKITTTYGLLLLLLSWGVTFVGATSLLALIIGILLLDIAVQGVHITNQSVIYRRMPEARNRLTSGYMTSYFIGGAVGSLTSTGAFHLAGWPGVCLAGIVFTLLSILVWWRGLGYESDNPA